MLLPQESSSPGSCRTLHENGLRIIGRVDRIEHPAATGVRAVRQAG